MQITGEIKRILDIEEVSESFKKREFDVVTNDQYPQVLRVQVVQDKCSILDSFSEGQSVQVSINLKGREWTNPSGEIKVFNTIESWKIDAI
ncbi:MAG: DUF3127 domain-containing protein [Flavobacteriaceae bacterium]|nr:DUF3127 domain-containing protein [Flavobacteriaceae bacterium]